MISDYIGANSDTYPLDYLVMAGTTSRGDIEYGVYEYNGFIAGENVRLSSVCYVGETIATQGYNGSKEPLYLSSGKTVARIYINCGTKRNSSYANYIGTFLASSEDTSINKTVSDVAELSEAAAYEAGIDRHQQMINERINMEELIRLWDGENEQIIEE